MMGLLAIGACSGSGPGELHFLAVLSGGNEVPPIITLSGATASFTASGDQIGYAIQVQNITGVTDAGIYLGAAGVVGPKVADLYSGATSGPIASGSLVTGTISASGLTALSLDSLTVLMHNGSAYVNIITATLPNGEIRGQIYQN
jgi:hypothetical protein